MMGDQPSVHMSFVDVLGFPSHHRALPEFHYPQAMLSVSSTEQETGLPRKRMVPHGEHQLLHLSFTSTLSPSLYSLQEDEGRLRVAR